VVLRRHHKGTTPALDHAREVELELGVCNPSTALALRIALLLDTVDALFQLDEAEAATLLVNRDSHTT
jgi:hypothetical protein